MTNDDSRGNQSPDRRNAPQSDYGPLLELIDSRATTILETVEHDADLEPETRRTAKRHPRELEWAHRALCDAPELPVASREGPMTVIQSPTTAAVEAARQRTRERAAIADAREPRTDRLHEPPEKNGSREQNGE
ncbi:hypothetical protein [Natronococcus wangiae]|uniref:hypothetical protein n=1 Tax=Natronococcus wangiae TaxID=3068275 RepID=UPI00273F04C6|nr:hypothetical protein [Natronococcus sp. AD5]